VLAGLLSASISVGSAYGMYWYVNLLGNVKTPPGGSGVTAQLPDEPTNVLIVGSDTREGLSQEEQGTKGSPEDVKGQRADTIILLHFDPDREQTVIVHLPRDLRVPIHGTGEVNKINTAFEGGAKRLVRTIQDFTRMPVHHYIEVNFAGFQRLVDEMGGVTICTDRALIDPIAELNIRGAGCHLLQGREALAFVRARHVEGDVIPDFARISRQQQFIRALLDQLFAPTAILKLTRLAEVAIDTLTVDENLNPIQIRDYVAALQGLGTPAVDFRVVPATPVTIDGIDYLEAVQPDTRKLFARLRSGAELGGIGKELAYTVQPANVRVRVFDAGGDTALVDRLLRRAGFDVLPSAAAPDGASDTAVVYAFNQSDLATYVLGYLTPRLGQLPVEVAPSGTRMGDAQVGVIVAPDAG